MYIYENLISEVKYNTVSITKGRSLLHWLVHVALFFAFCFSNKLSYLSLRLSSVKKLGHSEVHYVKYSQV